MRYLADRFLRARYSVRPDIRAWLDGFGLFAGMTAFFCLAASLIDWSQNRIRSFDGSAWWFQPYMILKSLFAMMVG